MVLVFIVVVVHLVIVRRFTSVRERYLIFCVVRYSFGVPARTSWHDTSANKHVDERRNFGGICDIYLRAENGQASRT